MSTPDPDLPVPCPARPTSASWQIPKGVTQGNWEYVTRNQIAESYDRFLEDDPLTLADRQIISRYLPKIDSAKNGPGPIVADFGCGNGRSLIPLLERGYRGIGIDLSLPMLTKFAEKTNNNSAPLGPYLRLQANLVELGGIATDSVDHGVSMFSTLGMIEHAENRSEFLAHVRRMIRPGGLFVLHAHNVWYQIRYPGGIRWILSSLMSSCWGGVDFGDRTAHYRGVSRLFIHSFRQRELQHAIARAGFKTTKWFGIFPNQKDPVERFPIGSSVRMVGWIVVCQ